MEIDNGWEIINKSLIYELESALDANFDILNPPRPIFSIQKQAYHYTLIYDLCTKRNKGYEDTIYQRYHEAINSFIRRKIRPALSKDEGTLILRIATAWTKFKTFSRVMKFAFSYLDRFYVELHGLQYLGDLAISEFKRIFIEYKDALSSDIIKRYEEIRELSESIDPELYEDVKICLDLFDAIDPSQILFKTNIGDKLLDSTNKYYFNMAKYWIGDYTLEDYILLFNETLNEEEARFRLIFGDKLESEVKETLITCMLTNLLDNIKIKLFEDNMFSHNINVYNTISLIPDGVKLVGDYIIEEIKKDAEAVNAGDLVDGQLIDYVMAVIEKVTSFFSNSNILDIDRSIASSLEWILNNKVSPEKSALYLARYINGKMELQSDISAFIKLFQYLYSKKSFINYYQFFLSQRLLSGINFDYELLCYQLLCRLAGSAATAKIYSMIKDIENSICISDSLIRSDSVFTLYCLNGEYWSELVGDSDNTRVELHSHFKGYTESFECSYTSAFKHRKLSWVPNLGRVTLKSSDGVDIECDLVQATLILHYSDNIRSISEIAALMSVDCKFIYDLIDNINKSHNIFKIINNRLYMHFMENKCLSIYNSVGVPDFNNMIEKNDNSLSIDAAIVRILKGVEHMELSDIIRKVQDKFESVSSEYIMLRLNHMVSSGHIGYNPPKTYYYIT